MSNWGLRRDLGTVRTSITCSIRLRRRNVVKAGRVCVEWPMVKTSPTWVAADALDGAADGTSAEVTSVPVALRPAALWLRWGHSAREPALSSLHAGRQRSLGPPGAPPPPAVLGAPALCGNGIRGPR